MCAQIHFAVDNPISLYVMTFGFRSAQNAISYVQVLSRRTAAAQAAAISFASVHAPRTREDGARILACRNSDACGCERVPLAHAHRLCTDRPAYLCPGESF